MPPVSTNQTFRSLRGWSWQKVHLWIGPFDLSAVYGCHRVCYSKFMNKARVVEKTLPFSVLFLNIVWGKVFYELSSYLCHWRWMEVMFPLLFVCLFVCLTAVSRISQKVLWTDPDKIWKTCWVCDKDNLIRFWWGSGYVIFFFSHRFPLLGSLRLFYMRWRTYSEV